jgi:hypothetical protein
VRIKNRRRHNGFRPSLLAAIFGWRWLFGLAFFQLLKFVVPGASFAKDFGVRPDFRADVDGAGIENDAVALELEIVSFVFVSGAFDKKIDAAAYRAFHRFTPFPDKTEIRSTKFEIRKKLKI